MLPFISEAGSTAGGSLISNVFHTGSEMPIFQLSRKSATKAGTTIQPLAPKTYLAQYANSESC